MARLPALGFLKRERKRRTEGRAAKQKKPPPKAVENFSEFKCAETKFPSDDVRRRRRRNERKRRVWKLLQIARPSGVTVSHPNRNMYRPGSVTRPACGQVILLTANHFPFRLLQMIFVILPS